MKRVEGQRSKVEGLGTSGPWRQLWAHRTARWCLAVLAVFTLAALWGEAERAWYAWKDVTSN